MFYNISKISFLCRNSFHPAIVELNSKIYMIGLKPSCAIKQNAKTTKNTSRKNANSDPQFYN